MGCGASRQAVRAEDGHDAGAGLAKTAPAQVPRNADARAQVVKQPQNGTMQLVSHAEPGASHPSPHESTPEAAHELPSHDIRPLPAQAEAAVTLSPGQHAAENGFVPHPSCGHAPPTSTSALQDATEVVAASRSRLSAVPEDSEPPQASCTGAASQLATLSKGASQSPAEDDRPSDFQLPSPNNEPAVAGDGPATCEPQPSRNVPDSSVGEQQAIRDPWHASGTAGLEERQRVEAIEASLPSPSSMAHINIDSELELAKTLLQADAIAVGLWHDRSVLRIGGAPETWCTRLCGALLEQGDAATVLVGDLRDECRPEWQAAVAGDAAARFFCATTLAADPGQPSLGILCMGDSKPRVVSASQRMVLAHLATVVKKELQAAYMQAAQKEQVERLLQEMDAYKDAFLFVDTATPGWRIMHLNQAAQDKIGLTPQTAVGALFWDLFCRTDATKAADACEAAVTARRMLELTALQLAGPGAGAMPARFLNARLRPATTNQACYFVGLYETLSGLLTPSGHGSSGGEAATEAAAYAQPTPFAGLELGPLLGKGGHGRVYLGLYQGVIVAVKIISDASLVRMKGEAPLEAVITAGIAHANIVRTLAYSWFVHRHKRVSGGGDGSERGASSPGAPGEGLDSESSAATPATGADDFNEMWMLLEYCDRGSLQEAVNKGLFLAGSPEADGGPQPRKWDAIFATGSEIAAGMAFLHARGVIHGDLTGGNVLLAAAPVAPHGFCAKVADFGLARDLDVKSRIQTKTYGTITHMPVEVLVNGVISKAADVYAFGVLLWEMAAGQRAWSGMHCTQVIIAVTVRRRKLEVPPTTPPALGALIQRCFAENPKERPTFMEASKALRELRMAMAAAQRPGKLLEPEDLRDRAASCPS